MAQKFIKSAEGGDTQKLKALLEEGTEINIRDQHGRTALYAAAEVGEVDAMKHLLQTGGRVNAKNLKRWTPLHVAAFNGHAESVEVLLGAGADKDRANKREATPLMLACRKAQLACVQTLVQSGCNTSRRDMWRRRALHWAVKGGDLDVVKYLVENKVDINAADDWGKTPVFQAAKSNQPQILQYLLSEGATSGSDRNGRQAIHVAAEKNSASATKVLIQSGISPDSPLASKRNPLMDATFNCHVASIIAFIEAGANVNAADGKGSIALHHLIYSRALAPRHFKHPWFDIAIMLLRANANIDISTDHPIFFTYQETHHSQNALELAMKGGYKEFVQMFIRCGSNIGNTSVYLSMKTKELTKYVSKNVRLLDLIRKTYKTPHKLKILARKQFRLCMPSVHFSQELDKMGVAPGLKSFIMYDDLEEVRDEVVEEAEGSLLERYPEKSPSPDSDSEYDYEPSIYNSSDHLDKIAIDSD